MWRVVRWASSITLILPSLLLALVAIPRFQSGLALDAVYPVPILMTVGAELPQLSYRDTVEILAEAHSADGETLLLRAEAASMMQPQPVNVVSLLEAGLASSPASSRGWALLAEQYMDQEPMRAGSALSLSLLLGPYEYYVAVRRAHAAARLWDNLSPDMQSAALRQTRLLWSDVTLHGGMESLLAMPKGDDLVAHAFQDQPEELRAINRWTTMRRREISR